MKIEKLAENEIAKTTDKFQITDLIKALGKVWMQAKASNVKVLSIRLLRDDTIIFEVSANYDGIKSKISKTLKPFVNTSPTADFSIIRDGSICYELYFYLTRQLIPKELSMVEDSIELILD